MSVNGIGGPLNVPPTPGGNNSGAVGAGTTPPGIVHTIGTANPISGAIGGQPPTVSGDGADPVVPVNTPPTQPQQNGPPNTGGPPQATPGGATNGNPGGFGAGKPAPPTVPANGGQPNPNNGNGVAVLNDAPRLQGAPGAPNAGFGNGVGPGTTGFGTGPGAGNGTGAGFGVGNGTGTTGFGIGNGIGAGTGTTGIPGTPVTGGAATPAFYANNTFAFSQNSFITTMAVLQMSDPQTLQSNLQHAIRRHNSSSHQQWAQAQASSQHLAETFAQMSRANTLAFIRAPGYGYGPAGPTALLNNDENVTLTRMIANAMREYRGSFASNTATNPALYQGQSQLGQFQQGQFQDQARLTPHSVLSAYGLMHADRLGADWLAQGIAEVVRLAQGAGPQDADAIFEALAHALMLSALASLNMPQGANRELALAQGFAAMQLVAQMQDPDAFAQLFLKLGSPQERLQFLALLASLNPNAKLQGLDALDAMASLFKSVAARSGAAHQGNDLQAMTRQSIGLHGGYAPGRADAHMAERLRSELLQFVAMQPAHFYYAETPTQKQFHSQRMEAVLQLIVQEILRELAAKAGRLAKLRSDFADSIELLSNLLDLLAARDEEDSEESRHGDDGEEAEESDESGAENAEEARRATLRYEHGNAMRLRRSIEAEYYCQYLFRVVPDDARKDKVTFRWENFQANPISHVPRQMDAASPVFAELKALSDHARQSAVASVELADQSPRAILAELLMPGDPAYALGASAAGTTIMARHWHCKMWAHDLTYRLNYGQSQMPFNFVPDARGEHDANAIAQSSSTNKHPADAPRSESAMRLDLLRMLENSRDRWVREQASSALAAGLRKLSKEGGNVVETKGETVRALRTPMLRDATIYFLSRYYFKLKASEPQRQAA